MLSAIKFNNLNSVAAFTRSKLISNFCLITTCSQQHQTNKSQDQLKLVAVAEAKRFIVDCLAAVDSPKDHAQAQADLLVEADYRGHFSHGMNRLEMYVNDLRCDLTDGHAVPKILKENGATAWVDGCNGLGAVVGNFSMQLAIEKAKTNGIGIVTAKGSNHYGIASWYGLQAVKEGLIGISMTNTSPLLSPTRSRSAALGTNPITVCAPGKNGDDFLFDMATTTVALGKIEIQRRKKAPIPLGWAQGPDGKETTDAEVAYDATCLMPLGGSELNSGYKGYGLAATVELFCGILSNANFATKVRKWNGDPRIANLGQCFIAIDPECFAPDFTDRLSELHHILRCLDRVDESKPVLIPGDPERAHMAKVDEMGGVGYLENQIITCNTLSNELKVKQIQFV